MKAKIVLIVTLCLISFSFNTYAQDKKDKKSEQKKVIFDVSMTCDNCKKRIEKNIAFEKGVSDMKVDLPHKQVMVMYNATKTDIEKLQKAFGKLGYTAEVHDEAE